MGFKKDGLDELPQIWGVVVPLKIWVSREAGEQMWLELYERHDRERWKEEGLAIEKVDR